MIDTPNMCTVSKPTCHSSPQTIKQAEKTHFHFRLHSDLTCSSLSLGFLDESFLSLARDAARNTCATDFDPSLGGLWLHYMTVDSVSSDTIERGQLISSAQHVGSYESSRRFIVFKSLKFSASPEKTFTHDSWWRALEKKPTQSLLHHSSSSRGYLNQFSSSIAREGWVVSPNDCFADCCSVLESVKRPFRWNVPFGETTARHQWHDHL